MNSRVASSPSNDDLREWAYGRPTAEPIPDWDLVLSWGMDRGRLRTCVDLAGDPDCPAARFFLLVLYQWVAQAANRGDFAVLAPLYSEWVDSLGAIHNPMVMHWCHQAKLVLHGAAFDRDEWFNLCVADVQAVKSPHNMSDPAGQPPTPEA